MNTGRSTSTFEAPERRRCTHVYVHLMLRCSRSDLNMKRDSMQLGQGRAGHDTRVTRLVDTSLCIICIGNVDIGVEVEHKKETVVTVRKILASQRTIAFSRCPTIINNLGIYSLLC